MLTGINGKHAIISKIEVRIYNLIYHKFNGDVGGGLGK